MYECINCGWKIRGFEYEDTMEELNSNAYCPECNLSFSYFKHVVGKVIHVAEWNKHSYVQPNHQELVIASGVVAGERMVIEAIYNKSKDEYTVELFQSYDPHWEEYVVEHVKTWIRIMA